MHTQTQTQTQTQTHRYTDTDKDTHTDTHTHAHKVHITFVFIQHNAFPIDLSLSQTLRCAVCSEPEVETSLIREFISQNAFNMDEVAEALASVFVDGASVQSTSHWHTCSDQDFLEFAGLAGDQVLFGHKLLDAYERYQDSAWFETKVVCVSVFKEWAK